MSKTSTLTRLVGATDTISQPAPSPITLAKIRQLARAYSFVNLKQPALGSLVLN